MIVPFSTFVEQWIYSDPSTEASPAAAASAAASVAAAAATVETEDPIDLPDVVGPEVCQSLNA